MEHFDASTSAALLTWSNYFALMAKEKCLLVRKLWRVKLRETDVVLKKESGVEIQRTGTASKYRKAERLAGQYNE